MGKKEKRKRNRFMEYTNRIGENRMRGADCSIDGISRQKKGGVVDLLDSWVAMGES